MFNLAAAPWCERLICSLCPSSAKAFWNEPNERRKRQSCLLARVQLHHLRIFKNPDTDWQTARFCFLLASLLSRPLATLPCWFWVIIVHYVINKRKKTMLAKGKRWGNVDSGLCFLIFSTTLRHISRHFCPWAIRYPWHKTCPTLTFCINRFCGKQQIKKTSVL